MILIAGAVGNADHSRPRLRRPDCCCKHGWLISIRFQVRWIYKRGNWVSRKF